MRHLKAGRKLGRTSAHRRALYSNLVAALVTHGKIETTEAKAKELRSVADRTIHWGVAVADIVKKGRPKGKPTTEAERAERARLVHAKRMARRVLKDDTALDRLFTEIAPQLVGRPGGYTRLLKTRTRVGDAAPMAIVQIVGGAGERREAPAPAADDAKPTKGGKKKAEAAAAAEPKKPARKTRAKKSDEE